MRILVRIAFHKLENCTRLWFSDNKLLKGKELYMQKVKTDNFTAVWLSLLPKMLPSNIKVLITSI